LKTVSKNPSLQTTTWRRRRSTPVHARTVASRNCWRLPTASIRLDIYRQ